MEGNTDRHATDSDRPMKYLQTSPAGDVDNGADEAGDVFSHTVASLQVQGRRLQQPSPSHAPDVILIKHL